MLRDVDLVALIETGDCGRRDRRSCPRSHRQVSGPAVVAESGGCSAAARTAAATSGNRRARPAGAGIGDGVRGQVDGLRDLCRRLLGRRAALLGEVQPDRGGAGQADQAETETVLAPLLRLRGEPTRLQGCIGTTKVIGAGVTAAGRLGSFGWAEETRGRTPAETSALPGGSLRPAVAGRAPRQPAGERPRAVLTAQVRRTGRRAAGRPLRRSAGPHVRGCRWPTFNGGAGSLREPLDSGCPQG